MKSLPFALILLAAPATAQTLSLPGNCTAYLTVQSQGCTVGHYLTCTGDPAGYQHRVEHYSDGYDFINTIDREGQWISSNDVYAGGYDVLGQVQTDPLSLSNMIENGQDEMDFTMEHSNGAVTRYIGSERMTGETAVIDGITLLRAEYTMESLDANGTQLWRAEGREFISPGWRIYFSELTTWYDPGADPDVVASAPVEFIMPGEPGFLSTVPINDCAPAE